MVVAPPSSVSGTNTGEGLMTPEAATYGKVALIFLLPVAVVRKFANVIRGN